MHIEQDDLLNNGQGKKKTKATTIIIILIIITVITVIGIIFAIMSMRGNKLSVSIDGQSVSFTSDTFLITDDRKDIYINKRYSTTCWI